MADTSESLAVRAEPGHRDTATGSASEPPFRSPNGPPVVSSTDTSLAGALRVATEYSIIGTDANGIVAIFNDGAQRMLGYSFEEVVGKVTPLVFHDPEEVAARAQELGIAPGLDVFLAVPRNGVAETRTWTYVRKDGSRLPVSLTVAALRDVKGDVIGFIGIARDITDQRRATEELRRLSHLQESILNSAGEGIYGLDRAGCASFINPAAARMLGYEIEELIGASLHEIIHHSKPDGSPYSREECPIFGALRDGAVHHVSGEVLWRRDGTSFPVEYVSTPIREGSSIVGAVVIFRDVTERKRAEEEHARLLRQAEEAEERFRSLLECAPDAIVISNDEGRIVLVNRQTEEMFGYSRDEMLGQFVEMLIPLRFREMHVMYRAAYSSAPRTRLMGTGFELVGLRKDGTEFPAEISLSPSMSTSGLLTTSIIRDVTERKRAEEEREQLLAREQAARTRAEDAARIISRLQTVTDAALAHLALDELLDELLDRISDVLGVDTAVILLLDEDNTLTPRAWRSPIFGTTSPIRIPVGEGFAGRVAAERRAIAEENVDNNRLLNPDLREARVRSLLGVPLLVEGRVIGVLHVGTVDARHFSADDTQLLQLVADRVAMAVDRARLYEQQRAARAAAEDARHRVEFLSEASKLLASSLDYQTTLANVARLAVPTLADACFVDLLEDGVLRQVAVAHTDPEYEALLEQIRRRHPVDLTASYGIARVLRTGRSEIATVTDDIVVASAAGDLEYASLLRQLAFTSYLTVPLQARGRTLGTISFLLAKSDRQYGPDDLALAEDLAGRCALAVDNARLHREAQQALEREQVARAEAEKLAAERTTILAKITDGVVIADPSGRAVYLNEAARRLLQVAAPDAANDRISKLDHPYSGLLSRDGHPLTDDELPIVRAAVHGETVIGTEMRIRRAGGKETVMEGSATPVVTENGLRLGAVMTLHDVTTQRDLERQKDEFLANVSHDLRTPLTAIKASIGVVLANEQPGTPEPLHRMFVNIQIEADRMAALVSDLLELTRLQAKRVQFRPVHCDLRDVVLRSAREIEPLTQARRQQLRVLVPTEPIPGMVDVDRLERALLNILSNAHKYGRSEGRIVLSLEKRDDEVVFAVSDDGPGIPEEEQKHIFERFYRSETEAVRRRQGSGLGLPIAKAMVELHGGRIWVESQPGKGATFRIALPLASAPISCQEEDG